MGKLLYLVGTYLLSDALRRILVGAGLGLVSSQFILTVLQSALTQAATSINGLTGTAASFLALCGADVALSVIAGALVTRAAMEATKIGLRKISA